MSTAPPLQGRGRGGAVSSDTLCEALHTPYPSPEGEGLAICQASTTFAAS